jgi:hypothetical protein
MHAWGLRLRGVLRMLAIAHPSVLPSAMWNDVGTPVAIISQLNTQPACAPVNASPAALRLPTHDSGPGWLATPFLCDSFIHNSTPVYPGALRIPLYLPSRAWLRPYGGLQTAQPGLDRQDGIFPSSGRACCALLSSPRNFFRADLSKLNWRSVRRFLEVRAERAAGRARAERPVRACMLPTDNAPHITSAPNMHLVVNEN